MKDSARALSFTLHGIYCVNVYTQNGDDDKLVEFGMCPTRCVHLIMTVQNGIILLLRLILRRVLFDL